MSKIFDGNPSWTYTLDGDPIHTFSDDEKIAWLEGRIERMLLVPLRDAEIRTGSSQRPGPAYDLNLGSMTLACCAIEALGRFYLGGTQSVTKCSVCEVKREDPGAARCFRKFIKEYLKSYKQMSQVLYDSFRSALAHSFAITDGCITASLDKPFRKGNRDSPHEIDFDRFIKALDAGIEQYFRDLSTRSDLRANFLKHWDREYGFWIRIAERRSKGET